MLRNVNEVTLIGNIGKKPELRKTPSGVAVTDFTLATSKKWKNAQGEEKSETTWHKIVCWSYLAETVCKILNVGDLTYIKGHISNRIYEKDDQKFNITEIIAENVLIMSPSNHDTAADEETTTAAD